MELQKKYRPTKLSELVGQSEAVKTLQSFGKVDAVPQFLLLVGPSGCGKTTIARILQSRLGCSDLDFKELNAADSRGIDTVREIRDRMGMSAIGGGKCRIYLIDEAARLTNDAQSALLKMLEDTPPGVYFILATTDPQKLLPTIRTRATEIKVKLVKDPDMEGLLKRVAAAENFDLSDAVREKIVAVAEGSPRKALVLFNQIFNIAEEQDQLAAVSAGVAGAAAIDLARALVGAKPWTEVSKLLKNLEDEPEGLRRMILGYCSSVMLSGGKQGERAFGIAEVFMANLYDSGKPGLVTMCYEVTHRI